jgi:hypothetical protein
MLNQETAEKLGVELELLQSTFEGFTVMSNDDLTSLKNNMTKDSEEVREKYQSEGRKVGKELLLKELKESFNLDYEGRKSKDNFINAINEKFSKATNEEYSAKINELSKALETKAGELESFKSEIKTQENKRLVSDALTKEFNQYNGKTAIPVDDLITLYTAKNSVKYDGESIKIFNGDQVVKDDVLNPVTIQSSIKDFVEGSYLVEQKPTGGRGEGDSKGSGSAKTTAEKYSDNLVKQGIALGSAEHSQKMMDAVAQNIIEV